MKDRITVLMGAGAMMDYTKVSTDALTEKIVENCQKFRANNCCRSSVEISECPNSVYYSKSVVEFVRDLYKEKTKKDANFEMIFHMLEVIFNYRKDNVQGENLNTENVITNLNEKFSCINFSSVYKSIYKILDVINDEIFAYDSNFENKGKSFKMFFEKLLESGQCLDVFNLNYDTWVEQSIPEYTDGFVAENSGIMHFDSRHYIKECDQNRISHLHGQINFGFLDAAEREYSNTQDELCKFENYNNAKENRIVINGSDTNQSGRKIIYSNIVTGLLKTDKILWHPLDVYHSMLLRSLIQNKRLLIIGYGFEDLYINKLLDLQFNANCNDKKIIIIDKMDDKNDEQYGYSSVPFRSSKKKVYLERIFQCNQWFKQYKKRDTYFCSEEGDVCVYGNGFRKVIEENIEELLYFLQ